MKEPSTIGHGVSKTNDREYMMNLTNLVSFLLPQMALAGDYAMRIQPKIKSQPSKEGKNIFQQALTDADLSVQNFFEVNMLAAYPEISFSGEEDEKSMNHCYFQANQDYELVIDPINGTRLFIDQLDVFDIILSLTYHEEPVVALTYLPGRESFYFAIKGEGAFTLSRNELKENASWNKLILPKRDDRIMVFQDDELVSSLSKNVRVFDFLTEYETAPVSCSMNGVLFGELGGFAKRPAHLLDWGAVAFIVQEAGGIVTDFRGEQIKKYSRAKGRITRSILGTVDDKLHAQALESLASLPL